jgi:hypothetical protein
MHANFKRKSVFSKYPAGRLKMRTEPHIARNLPFEIPCLWSDEGPDSPEGNAGALFLGDCSYPRKRRSPDADQNGYWSRICP